MKICFFYYSMLSGGAERTISNLSNYAVFNGHEVSVLTMCDRPSFYKLDEKVNHIGLSIDHSSKNIFDAIATNIKDIKVIKKTLREISPDIVVCFSPTYITLAKLARGRVNYKIVGAEISNPFLLNKGFWNKQKRNISKWCKGFIFQTEGAKSYYPKKTQKNSIVLPNSMCLDDFIANEKEWAGRKGILTVGRLDNDKRFDDLLRAFKIVSEKYPDITLDIYGDGDKRKELENLADSLGISDKVCFKGRVKDIAKEYSEHKIFVMTSIREGMPNALIEGMISGCACVSTDCDFGPSELITDRENGLLVKVHDIEGIANGICSLIEDDDLAKKLSQKAKEKRSVHSLDNIGKKFIDYCNKIISNNVKGTKI